MVDHNRIHIKYGLSECQLRDEFASSAVLWSTTGLNQTDQYGENSQESFGLAIAESMAMGCVPVAVNAGGVSEIIQNDVNGYLVNSPDEMGYATIRLLYSNDIWRRLSTAASTRSNHFSRETFRKKIEGLFLSE
jgi:glycosyltransferase involved in cell wall biosynthesis